MMKELRDIYVKRKKKEVLINYSLFVMGVASAEDFCLYGHVRERERERESESESERERLEGGKRKLLHSTSHITRLERGKKIK